MAKASFLLILIVFSAIAVSEMAQAISPQASSPQSHMDPCKRILFHYGCDPLACRETCTHQYHGNGECVDNGTEWQQCVCRTC
ncbi:hypothetical protein ACHQM5_014581 [Ranunculus cassubicifolius]